MQPASASAVLDYAARPERFPHEPNRSASLAVRLGVNASHARADQHGRAVGALLVHADGVRSHPHGCGGGQPQPLHL